MTPVLHSRKKTDKQVFPTVLLIPPHLFINKVLTKVNILFFNLWESVGVHIYFIQWASMFVTRSLLVPMYKKDTLIYMPIFIASSLMFFKFFICTGSQPLVLSFCFTLFSSLAMASSY